MRRGDIYLVDFEPARGSEVDKARPAILVSNDGANRQAERLGRGVLAVVPMTSNIKRVFPFQVRIPATSTGLDHDSKAQAEQVKAVDFDRFFHQVGSVSAEYMAQVDDALRVHLDL
ncbi:type II toxin-antitoxin system PemK/MazF family toxin [Glycomyces niveus]|uniref:mRNA interferase n=1 Tax=Glycomyces niveus TaxID=2820287 RepID=A0ABS3U3J7_9ACTN|nr:type II toxin-antitoxin system PemK/MazF family toxin [Glycomyces sp. NEAU-S30]MBO3733354.1 type II toxin-antitoxin system PemK/MazF family toxin [Glycomyces sp. NEAU-S30]